MRTHHLNVGHAAAGKESKGGLDEVLRRNGVSLLKKCDKRLTGKRFESFTLKKSKNDTKKGGPVIGRPNLG